MKRTISNSALRSQSSVDDATANGKVSGRGHCPLARAENGDQTGDDEHCGRGEERGAAHQIGDDLRVHHALSRWSIWRAQRAR
jgi:hypothetical protein